MITEFDIASWFRDGKEKGCTHLIVVCDASSNNEYPVFVHAGEDARKKASKYGYPAADGLPTLPNKKGQRVEEVYALGQNMSHQINKVGRTFHLE